eukprot:1736111-Alexandrium_andersonii.AAC.1
MLEPFVGQHAAQVEAVALQAALGLGLLLLLLVVEALLVLRPLAPPLRAVPAAVVPGPPGLPLGALGRPALEPVELVLEL